MGAPSASDSLGELTEPPAGVLVDAQDRKQHTHSHTSSIFW